MANYLSMATSDYILTLHQRGWSQRRIARELNVEKRKGVRLGFLDKSVG